MQACRECGAGAPLDAHFCPQCSKILPLARQADYFGFLGLPRKLTIGAGDLEQRFRALSRQFHPDYFYNGSTFEKRASLERSSFLNDAYRTLKQPAGRIEYLLKLEGAEIGEEHSGKNKDARKDPSRVPADLLEEVFDLNMQLEEMRAARKMGETDPDLQSTLEQAKRKFDGLQDEVDQDLNKQWQVWDEGDAATRKKAEKTMVALLDRRRYLSNLVRDVTETLGA